MEKERLLDIIALTKNDAEFIKDVLKRNILENITINCYSVEEGLNITEKAQVVLISGPFLKEQAYELYPGSTIICAKRILTGENFEKIMILPRGEKVLVVNYPKEIVEETINSLIQMGLTHLDYVPYYGNEIDFKGIDIAISPGHFYLCPAFIKNRIDLKRRTLTLSTFMEVLNALGLSIENLNNFGGQHIRHMINAGREVAELLMYAEQLRMNLKCVVDRIQEGIVAVNTGNKISVFNPVAEEIFGLRSDNVLGKSYQKVFGEYPEVMRYISGDENESEIILSVKGKKLLANFTFIESFGEKGMICNFKKISSIQRLEENVRRQLNKKGYYAKYNFLDIKGNSPVLIRAIARAKKFASTDLTVLINGESGTGKELFAHAIHNESRRSKGPFIAVNFAALPDNLVESELFGYEEGSFTGALKGGKAGLFEQAHKGTIFLDEIGDASLSVQTRLLRVLQEKEIMRVGASKLIPVDIRVLAATNKDITQLVEEGKFREDLYYRLKVLQIEVPPLRMRKQDIPMLIKEMMSKEKKEKEISKEAMQKLMSYQWPGNVRELLNVIKYTLSVCEESIITLDDLPPDILEINRTEEINEVKRIKNILESTGHPLDYLFILKKLKQIKSKEITIGRKKLSELAKKEGLVLTEEKIRTRLGKMSELKLVFLGTTRQGCCITEKGIQVLDYWGSI